MYNVTREIYFNYGHRLLHHAGKCGHLHGHNGRIQVEISSQKLDQQNMVVDFAQIKETLGTWIDEALDHKTLLWDQDPLVDVLRGAGEPVVVMKENPTAEALARWIYEEARALRLAVSRVTVWESDDAFASYHT